MKLLNLGCGATRPGAPWTNIDNLSTQLLIGSPERSKLDSEPNYIDADITRPLPIMDEDMDGVLLSHVLEHFDAPQGLELLREAHRVLKPGGIVLVSVPDASYFRKVYPEDEPKNWQRLYGEGDPEHPPGTFLRYALWFDQHKAILTEDALWSYLVMAGFNVDEIHRMESKYAKHRSEWIDGTATTTLCAQLNRFEFSCVMIATK